MLLDARDLANEPGSGLILDNLTAPPHPSFGGGFGGTLLDRLADLAGTPERIEAETADDRSVDVIYWVEVADEEERAIVGNLAYWCGCWATKSPMPTGGGVEWADG